MWTVEKCSVMSVWDSHAEWPLKVKINYGGPTCYQVKGKEKKEKLGPL